MHLTNYGVQKRCVDFDHADDPRDGTRGSKRTLSSVLPVLAAQGVDTARVWRGLCRARVIGCARRHSVARGGGLRRGAAKSAALGSAIAPSSSGGA